VESVSLKACINFLKVEEEVARNNGGDHTYKKTCYPKRDP